VNKPYNYKQFPDSYVEVKQDYDNYYHLTGCQSGETIASIGAGNGITEIQISCFNEGIRWYLQEIDSTRLYQFEEVLKYHESVVGSPINANFNLVLGTEDTTHLPNGVFDRVLMLNVFHEIESRRGIMTEIHQLLNENGVLVIMERMGNIEGEIHGDCKYPKLVEDSFLQEMREYGYALDKQQLGEEMSNLMFYSFVSEK
ncbi:MAG: methyltransferase domain-containing protein, partial [Bacteroidota bacterium]